MRPSLTAIAVCAVLSASVHAQDPDGGLRTLVEHHGLDRNALGRRYDCATSPERLARMAEFQLSEEAALKAVDYAKLSNEGRIDHQLLSDKVRHERRELERLVARVAEMDPWIPYAATLRELHDARRDRVRPDPRATAETLDRVAREAKDAKARLADEKQRPARHLALRMVRELESLQGDLREWLRFHEGYDPLVSWWCAQPAKAAQAAIGEHARFLRETVVGHQPGTDEPVVGDPIGRAALLAHLEHERIAYTPEELVEIARREFAWCDEQMLAASREMGFGDDWKAAMEKVKNLHVEPGEQPQLIVDLAHEAIDFLEQRDLLTIPELAKEIWRVEMMSPQAQKTNPFFLGGEAIIVSYPTDGMEHADKLMSMRGNNRHFAHATVHHEVIPGHHLQGYMTDRHNRHRDEFGTPFWTEGWALYWEMRMWDLGFARGPEDRIGMLFWRMHRCARIVFSLSFHLGTMTPEQCVDFLVDRVNHERANAQGEVRRSFNGDYSPLYQVGYMIGGLQLRALHKELVASGRLTEREFHDSILTGGTMPIEGVRWRLTKAPEAPDAKPAWRFAD